MNRLQLFQSLLKYAINDPQGGIELVRSRLDVWQDSKTKKIVLPIEPKATVEEVIRNFYPSLDISFTGMEKSVKLLQDHVNNFFQKCDDTKYPSKDNPYLTAYSLDAKSSFLLYALCRVLKPEIIVETGVAYGLSSSYFLQALHENNKGRLYSIDYVFRPWESKEMIGSMIPSHLKTNWTFVYGMALQKLKRLLTSLGMIDMFFHDSLHTYKNMKFEFETTWPFIRSGGFLVSDDIAGNNAFFEFYTKWNLNPIILSQDRKGDSLLGIIQKP